MNEIRQFVAAQNGGGMSYVLVGRNQCDDVERGNGGNGRSSRNNGDDVRGVGMSCRECWSSKRMVCLGTGVVGVLGSLVIVGTWLGVGSNVESMFVVLPVLLYWCFLIGVVMRVYKCYNTESVS